MKESRIQKLSLRDLRKNKWDIKPTHYCENCRCYRFSPCTCARKAQK